MIKVDDYTKQQMTNIVQYSNYYNSENYILQEYHQRSIYDSNIVEFWAPVTDKVIPNVIPFRYWVSTFGNTWNANTKRPFGLGVHRKGYLQYSGFCTTDGRQITRKLHRVIMMTFCYIPGCESLEVNHKDSNRKNNIITNLEWATSSENTIHGINHGYKKVFGSDSKVILTDEDVARIVNLHDNNGLEPYIIYNMLKREKPERFEDLTLILIENICRRCCRLSYFNNN